MNENTNYPVIPKGARCRNTECKKLITVTQGYVHLCRPERTNPNTGEHELFCDIKCHTEQERRERRITIVSNHSCIHYLEHER